MEQSTNCVLVVIALKFFSCNAKGIIIVEKKLVLISKDKGSRYYRMVKVLRLLTFFCAFLAIIFLSVSFNFLLKKKQKKKSASFFTNKTT